MRFPVSEVSCIWSLPFAVIASRTIRRPRMGPSSATSLKRTATFGSVWSSTEARCLRRYGGGDDTALVTIRLW
eukprot:8659627-Pyramimonas_sp.AAC.1